MNKDFGNEDLYKEELEKVNNNNFEEKDESSDIVFNGVSDINVARGKSRKKKATPKKVVSKISNKDTKSKKTKSTSSVSEEKKVTRKSSRKIKVTKNKDFINIDEDEEKIIVKEPFVDDDNNISGELLKVSNIKSREQVKKPKRIIFLASVYSILMLSLVVALFIKLSKPKKTLMKDPEETYADVGETRLLLERGEMEENESVEIEETLPEDEDFENSSKLIFERLKEASIKKEEEKVKKKIENNKKKNEESIEKEIEETTEEEVIEETTEERIEETTKKNAKNQDTKKVIDKEKVTEEETTEKETTKKNETKKEETASQKTSTTRKSMYDNDDIIKKAVKY